MAIFIWIIVYESGRKYESSIIVVKCKWSGKTAKIGLMWLFNWTAKSIENGIVKANCERRWFV